MKLKPEEALSAAVKDMLTIRRNQGRLRAMFFHVPNEFQATKNGAAAWAKKLRIGCVAGAPDWVVMWSGGGCFIELKTPQNKRGLSPEQLEFALECEVVGVHYHVCRSVEDVESCLKKHGALDFSR